MLSLLKGNISSGGLKTGINKLAARTGIQSKFSMSHQQIYTRTQKVSMSVLTNWRKRHLNSTIIVKVGWKRQENNWRKTDELAATAEQNWPEIQEDRRETEEKKYGLCMVSWGRREEKQPQRNWLTPGPELLLQWAAMNTSGHPLFFTFSLNLLCTCTSSWRKSIAVPPVTISSRHLPTPATITSHIPTLWTNWCAVLNRKERRQEKWKQENVCMLPHLTCWTHSGKNTRGVQRAVLCTPGTGRNRKGGNGMLPLLVSQHYPNCLVHAPAMVLYFQSGITVWLKQTKTIIYSG